MGKCKWKKSREYSDREAYLWTYFTGGTRNALYIPNAIWFQKAGKGVMTVIMYWRSRYELNPTTLRQDLSTYVRQLFQQRSLISIFTPLSLFKGHRVYQWEVTFEVPTRPTNEEMQAFFQHLDNFPLEDYADSLIA